MTRTATLPLRRAVLALTATLAVASGARAQDAAGAVPPVSRGDDFLWSGDGSTLFAIEHDAAGRLVAARAFDGDSGAPRWQIAGEPLAALQRAAAPAAPLAAVPSPDGLRLLLGIGGGWWVASAASGELAAAPELDGAITPRFAPDGLHLAFSRDGDLWTYELTARTVRRLTADGDATRDGEVPPEVRDRGDAYPAAGFEWASDSQRLAFYRRDASGAVRLAVLHLLDGEPRELELASEGAGLAVGWSWRFDSRALGVLWLSSDATRLDLRLCHPERLYCRPLASRPWSAGRVLHDDFRFLEDGFLWGSAGAEGAPLAFYDTLGRERRQLLAGGEVQRLGIVALLEPTREAAVAVERPDEPNFVRLLLVDLRNGTTTEIASAPSALAVSISPERRAWVRPRKAADGRFDGHLLERLDGTVLRRFE